MDRISESWRQKIGSFEKVNAGLQSSLAELRQENDDLKVQVGVFFRQIYLFTLLELNYSKNTVDRKLFRVWLIEWVLYLLQTDSTAF